MVDAARHLLTNWTPIPSSLLDNWDVERDTYLALAFCNTFVPQTTPVEELMGELCQQGTFNVWWDEWAQLVKMQGVRPPSDTVSTLNDTTGIIADSAVLTMDPDARLTRVLVYYSPIDVTKNDTSNYLYVTAIVEANGELPQAGGGARSLQIMARWVQSESQALQVASRTLLRYRAIPQMLSVKVSAKDRTIAIGDPMDITTRVVVDSEGKPRTKRWQVLSWSEVAQGQTYQLDMQDFGFTGRYAWIAALGLPDYTAASTLQKTHTCYLSDVNGLMSDGSPGYLLQ